MTDPERPSTDGGAPIDEELLRWVEATAGGTVVAWERPPGGGSRTMYLLEVERPDGAVESLVLRCEGGSSFTGTEISPAKEAKVYRALAGTSVPVPRVVGLAPAGAALLMERLPGEGDLERADAERRATVMRSFIDAVAELHCLAVDELDLSGFARPNTPEDHARLDLDTWARLAEGVPDLDPMIRYAGAWLRAHAPTHVQRTVLVQGDTGPGNFVHHDGDVTGIIDWEFAHLGDPMDDWAWIDMRNRGPVAEELRDRYTARTGLTIHQPSVDYYRAAVDYRCAITTSLAVSRGGGARGWAPYLLVTQRYLGDLASRMAQLAGVAEPVDVPPIERTPRTTHYDLILDGVRSAVAQLDDADLREQTRNLQILVHFLRAHDQVGAEVEALDREDRGATFGSSALDAATFASRVEAAGAVGDEPALRYLLRRTARERQLWASLLERPRH